MDIREVRESIKKDYVMIFIEDMYGNQLAYGSRKDNCISKYDDIQIQELEYRSPNTLIVRVKDKNNMTEDDVLNNLRALVGNDFDYDDIVEAFGDYSENYIHDVVFSKSDDAGYDYSAYIDCIDSTNFLITTSKCYQGGRLIKEIIADVEVR